MELRNIMEDLVWQRVEDVISAHRDACQCELCRYDVVALALNSLPPRYVVSEKGETLTKTRTMEQQFNTDVLTAISSAIAKVKAQPRHAPMKKNG